MVINSLKNILISFIQAIVLSCLLVLVGCANPYYDGPVSDHFDGQRFYNRVPDKNNLVAALKWMLTRKIGKWPDKVIQVYPPNLSKREYTNKIVATYIGHSTVLIQTQGLNILIDPVWSTRASPVSWLGPKRAYDIPIPLAKLPPIDVILVTHNHYDHLDLQTLHELYKLYKPKVLTGLGMDKFLHSEDIEASGLDWWNQVDVGHGIKVNFVPSQHWSSRGIWDKNLMLWGGFVIQTNLGQVYFAGDTGYCKEYFIDIARRFPKIKLSFLPIGAYKPRWFMEYSHMNPEEAVKAALDLRSEMNIATQHDSFAELADEGYGEAVRDLNLALKQLKKLRTKNVFKWFKALEPSSVVMILPERSRL